MISLENIIFIGSFTIIILEIIQQFLPKNWKIFKKYIIPIFIGFTALAVLLSSINKSKQDQIATEKKDNEITVLKNIGKVNQSKIDQLTNENNLLNHKLDRRYIPDTIYDFNFNPYEKLDFIGSVKSGDKIEVTNSNCNSHIWFHHSNQQPIYVEDMNWEFTFRRNNALENTYFFNQSNAPCRLILKVYSSDSPSTFSFQKTQSRRVSSLVNENCPITNIPDRKQWFMTMKYSNCIKPHPNIDWSKLEVYYSISFYTVDDKEYVLEGKKFAETHKGNFLSYSRVFPLETQKGYLKNCEIVIPTVDSYEKNGITYTSNGYIKLKKVEKINGKYFIEGSFYDDSFECQGSIQMVQDND